MQKSRPAPRRLQGRFEELRQQLSRIGYLTQGSVLDRSTLSPPRHGYQWTRKVRRKTVTVALGPAQYAAFGQAVTNYRTLWKTVTEMEKISRQILFQTIPDPPRRKKLAKRVLGLI